MTRPFDEAGMTQGSRSALDAAALRAQLPEVLRQGAIADGPMAALLDAMAALLGPRARLIDRGATLFDPLSAPEPLLPWLAHLLGYGRLFVDPIDPRRTLPLAQSFPPGATRLRQFLAAWPQLHASRGSGDGLCRLLEIATGTLGYSVVEEPTRQHVTVQVPAGETVSEAWLRRLIATERPAHLTWDIARMDAPR